MIDIESIPLFDPLDYLSPDEAALLEGALARRSDHPRAARPLFPTREEGDSRLATLFAVADDLLGYRDYREALERVRRRERDGELDSAEAQFLAAVIYCNQDEPGARQLAERHLRRAIALDPGNAQYRLMLAYLLRQRTLSVYADRELDRLLESDMDMADALCLKGILRLEVLWARSWYATSYASTGVYSRHVSVQQATEEALGYLHRALLFDPRHEMAAWWLTLHHILARQWVEVLGVSGMMAERGILVGEAHLARGMALQHLGHPEEAMTAYEGGLEVLGRMYGDAAGSPRWVLPVSEGGVSVGAELESLTAAEPAGEEEPEHFWRRRNPLLSTSVNERLMEQYRRFAHVTWVYSDVMTGIRGWETHRGAVYMRYGEPAGTRSPATDLRRKLGGWIDPSDEVGIDGGSFSALVRRRWIKATEEWVLQDGYRIPFGAGFITGDLIIWDPEYIGVVSSYARRTETVPELDAIVGFGGTRPMEARWYVFLDDPDRWAVIPAIRVPRDLMTLSWREASLKRAAPTPVHAITVDRAWNIRKQVSFSVPTDQPTRPELMSGFAGPPIEVERGEGVGAVAFGRIEATPGFARVAWTATEELNLEHPADRPFLSSIVLASDIRDQMPGEGSVRGAITRGGSVIVPRVNGRFEPRERVFLYFEVSGLVLDETGLGICRIDLELTSPEQVLEPGAIVRQALGRLIQGRTPEGRVLTSIERETISGRLEQWIELESFDWAAGRHVLRIRVHDEVSGAEFEREQTIVIGDGGEITSEEGPV